MRKVAQWSVLTASADLLLERNNTDNTDTVVVVETLNSQWCVRPESPMQNPLEEVDRLQKRW